MTPKETRAWVDSFGCVAVDADREAPPSAVLDHVVTTSHGAAVSQRMRSATGRPRVDGKFIALDDERFWIKGVTYGSFAENAHGEPFPPFHQLRADFAHMRDAGVNTVRLYAAPSDRIADAAAKEGLYLIPEICWAPRRCELDDRERVRFMFTWAKEHARRLKDHPAVLMHSIGNEIPPLVVRWYGRERITAFLRDLHECVKTEAPDALVTYVNHPPTEFLLLPFLDVVSFNIYLEREQAFRDYLARLQGLAGDRPLFLAELGLDSVRHGRQAQAGFVRDYLRASFEKGACGVAVYSWTDEWTIFDQDIGGWGFGVTDSARNPKPALARLRDAYTTDIYGLRTTPWPKVSVVVATYNGSANLFTCLVSLSALRYPDYEVIVVDDGSTDTTGEIARSFPFTYLRVQRNGGLSNARNVGLRAAAGDVVAYIDDDAFADPDWLYYMVTSLQEHDAAAVGGPNLPPDNEGFVAQCVDHAPGNPTHVLLGDELAEHVPGCNMAYVKAALEAIGGFDVTHRTAGDDVDVCWRLLVRSQKIVFSPSALVRHRRRSTVAQYRRQQRGYGLAEAHLARAYPSRFNVFGGAVWKGRVYTGSVGWRVDLLPRFFQPRIYHGVFGGGMFQAIYQPALMPWFQAATSFELQVLGAVTMLSGGLAMAFEPFWLGLGLFALGTMLLASAVACAIAVGLHAQTRRRWPGIKAVTGPLLVACLHLVQPQARAWGRLVGWWRLRGPSGFKAVDRVWGNMSQRHQWLCSLAEHLANCGWVTRPSDEWASHDLEILGPGPFRATLESVQEEYLEKGFHWVRYRIRVRPKPIAFLLTGLLVISLVSIVRAPTLLPLAIPLVYLLWVMITGRGHVEEAISQSAREVAAALDMPHVTDEFLC